MRNIYKCQFQILNAAPSPPFIYFRPNENSMMSARDISVGDPQLNSYKFYDHSMRYDPEEMSGEYID